MIDIFHIHAYSDSGSTVINHETFVDIAGFVGSGDTTFDDDVFTVCVESDFISVVAFVAPVSEFKL